MTNYLGIDYGLGQTNIDKTNGIRFGVISQHDVLQAWSDSAEADYGEPTCPKCGNDALNYQDMLAGDNRLTKLCGSDEEWDKAPHECEEYCCQTCEYIFGSESAYPDEALGYYVDDGEYKLTDCLDSDIMVIKSPYYTYAQFCSPCVPGAGNLNNPMDPDKGVKCYCLGHDWFEDGIAPYPVYHVSDDVQMVLFHLQTNLVASWGMIDCGTCNGLGLRTTSELAMSRECTIETIESDIVSGKIQATNFDPNKHTYNCWACNGAGKREEIVITELPKTE